MNTSRSRGRFALGTGVLAGALAVSSAAWACVGFKGHVAWEGNGVPTGVSNDGSNGTLNYPPTTGATWDLEVDGASNGGPAHHHCFATGGDALPGSGEDDVSAANSVNWYGGSIAPIVYMQRGNNGAQVALKISNSAVCTDGSGNNKMTQLDGVAPNTVTGYELYEASASGTSLEDTTAAPNGCHAPPGSVDIDGAGTNQIKVDSSGNAPTFVSATFKAGTGGGVVRMICVFDADGVTSDANAINTLTV